MDNLKQYFSKAFVKNLIKLVYHDVIEPAARDYVKKSDNKYDDAAIEFLDNFIEDLLKD